MAKSQKIPKLLSGKSDKQNFYQEFTALTAENPMAIGYQLPRFPAPPPG